MGNVIQDLEAEQLFLALVANEPSLIVPYSTRVDHYDLTDVKNSALWRGFNWALQQKQRPTIDWMRFWLEGKREGGRTLYEIVTESYLRTIYSSDLLLTHDPPIIDTDKVELFCGRILDAADRQLRYEISEELKESADAKGVNSDELWSELFGRVLERRRSRLHVRPIGEYWEKIKDHAEDWWSGKPGNLITTGYPSLDYALGGGLSPKRLIVLGGASGGGKTTTLLNIMYEMAKRGYGTGISSVEMAGEDLFMILACRESGVSYRDLRQGAYAINGRDLKPFERDKNKRLKEIFDSKVRELMSLPLQVDDRSENITSAQIYTSVLLAAAFSDIVLWGIDYAELLSDGVGSEDDVTRIPAIFKASKNLARLLGITVVLLSQLTKDLKHRPDAKPKVEDLRYGSPAPADYVWLDWYPGGLVATGDINKGMIVKQYGELGITGEPNQLVIIQGKARYGQNQFIVLDYEPAQYKLTDPKQYLATAWFTGQTKSAELEIQEGF